MTHFEMEDDPRVSDKQQIAVRLPAELAEKARNAVYWTPGMTLSQLAQIAFSHTLECMETLRGIPFPPRGGNLNTGRQMR